MQQLAILYLSNLLISYFETLQCPSSEFIHAAVCDARALKTNQNCDVWSTTDE